MKKVIGGVFVCLMGVAMAATVTLNPGNGVETNVTARFTGATDLVINSGATGGGIVTLANPLSTYTGKTTVNSGTLVVPDGDVAKGRSAIGAAGPIVLGPGTLRASGVLGAVVTNEYPASSKLATVLDVQDELHITNDFVQKTGCFIKTGPGTVYFSGANNRFGWDPDVANGAVADTANPLTLNANGDAPTKGIRGNVVIAEGKFHQVRRMFGAVGKPVLELRRLSFGPLPLDEALAPGEYRELTETEIAALYAAAGMEA